LIAEYQQPRIKKPAVRRAQSLKKPAAPAQEFPLAAGA
jgi:hypothetical protein